MSRLPLHNAFWREATRQGLVQYLDLLQDADDRRELYASENFGPLLHLGLHRTYCTAKGLAERGELNPSTISRWIMGTVAPPPSLRTFVIEWVRERARERLAQIDKYERTHAVMRNGDCDDAIFDGSDDSGENPSPAP